jgi:hypothetical protein
MKSNETFGASSSGAGSLAAMDLGVGSRRAAAALLVGAFIAVGCGKSDGTSTCTRYCLAIESAAGGTNTLFTIQGAHWAANSHVTASYGPYCSVNHACAAVLFSRAIPTSADGAFELEFRNGPAPLRLRGREGRRSVGGGPVRFKQRLEPGRYVRRTAHLVP